jgi:hypothetical protein
MFDANRFVGVFLDSMEGTTFPSSSTTTMGTTVSTGQTSTGETALQQLDFSFCFDRVHQTLRILCKGHKLKSNAKIATAGLYWTCPL